MRLSFTAFFVLASATSARATNDGEDATRPHNHVASMEGARGLLRGEAQVATGIINGHVAQPGEYPYAVSLQQWESHFCGGALIARDVVLTAAHCGGKLRGKVVLGRHDLRKQDGQVIEVVSEQPHPEYEVLSKLDSDFMLLYLKDPADTSYDIIAPNSDPNKPSINSTVKIAGWGDTVEDVDVSQTSDVLMELDKDVVSHEECESAWKDIDITPSMLCVEDFANRQYTCQGDSGGPVVQDDSLVGVVSFGVTGCVSETLPSVMGRVSHAYDWIREQVCAHACHTPAWAGCSADDQEPGPQCTDTMNWANHLGEECSDFEKTPGMCKQYGNEETPMGKAKDNCCTCKNPPRSCDTALPCKDTEDWTDSSGDGCEWYKNKEGSVCPLYGHIVGPMGAANDHCCDCKELSKGSTQSPTGGTPPPVKSVSLAVSPKEVVAKAARGLLRGEDQAATGIINGHVAQPGEYPYTASVQSQFGHHKCGGTLIARDVVLTAAHCQSEYTQYTDQVVLGRHDLRKQDGQVIPVWWQQPHLHYEREGLKNDFMLLYLKYPAITTQNVSVVTPNSDSNKPSVDSTVNVMGWGDTDIDTKVNTPSDVLMEVDTKVMSNEDCDSAYGGSKIFPNMLCAQDFANREDACQGDSGGPLVEGDSLVGVVSWGSNCASEEHPGVYARVSEAYDWIREQVCAHACHTPAWAGCSVGDQEQGPHCTDTVDWTDAWSSHQEGRGCSSFDHDRCVSLGHLSYAKGKANDNCCICKNLRSCDTVPPCKDTKDWTDYSGDGCAWYKNKDSSVCPAYGHIVGPMGAANDNCCLCKKLRPTDRPTSATPTVTSVPSTSPTDTPTNPPTVLHSEVKVDVLTDNYPKETSWTLINKCTGVAQESVVADTKYQAADTQYSDTYTVPSAKYIFEIRDVFGDGICCSYGNGSYSVTYNGKVEASGGDYQSLETTTFGACGPETTPGPGDSRGTGMDGSDENVTGSLKSLAEAEVQ